MMTVTTWLGLVTTSLLLGYILGFLSGRAQFRQYFVEAVQEWNRGASAAEQARIAAFLRRKLQERDGPAAEADR